MAYGIILLFDDAAGAAVTGYAQGFAAADHQMVLGDAAPPHVTLAHAGCDRDVALRWWERCSAELPRSVPVRFNGTMVSPVPEGDYYVPEGGVYVGLEAAKDPELELAHRVVTRNARAEGAELIGAVDDDFRPHVTLAVLRHGPVRVPPAAAALLRPATGLRPVLGRLGPFGTFPEIVT